MPNSRRRAAPSAARAPRCGTISLFSSARTAAGSTSITSRTAACGTANVWSPTVRDQRVGDRQRQRQLDHEPRALARRRCRASACRRAPAPSCARPPCRRRGRCRGRLRRASRSRARRAGRAARRRSSRRPGTGSPALTRARGRPPPASMPRPSSAISSDDRFADGGGAERDRALRRLAGGDALGRRLDAVADGVAHQVQHRVHHPLDQELVDLGVLAGELEPDLLAALAREVADHERHAAEDLADRHQPDAHHAFAQVAQLALDAPGVLLDRAPLGRRHVALDARQRFGRAAPGVITRSPIIRISSSSRARSTRTKCDGGAAASLAARRRSGCRRRPEVPAAGGDIGSSVRPCPLHCASSGSSRPVTTNSKAMPPFASIFGVAWTISPASRSRARIRSTVMPALASSADGENRTSHWPASEAAGSGSRPGAPSRRRPPSTRATARAHRRSPAPVCPSRRAAMSRSSTSTPSTSAFRPVTLKTPPPLSRREVALEMVRELLGLAQLDHPGQALHRVETAKQLFRAIRADRPVAGVRLDLQQNPPHRGQVLVALREVVVHELGEEVRSSRLRARHACLREMRAPSASRRPIRSDNSAGTNGLVMYAVAPAAIAASRLESSPRVVNTTTGRRLHPRMTPHELEHLEAVQIRHVEVQDHQRHRLQGQLLDRLETARRLAET